MLASPENPRGSKKSGFWPHEAETGCRNRPRAPEDRGERKLSNTRGCRDPSDGWIFRRSVGPVCIQPEGPIGERLLNPYPGLRAFEAEEDHLFFGREKEVD